MMQAFQGAVARFRGRLILAQLLGNILLMLLAAGWLQIPDSHTWQFVFSMLSGVLLVIAFLWLYTATFRHLRPCTPLAQLDSARGLRSTVVVAIAADRRAPGARGLVCRLLELSIPAVAAPSSRLLVIGRLAGTSL
jgi:hypothetical protein